MRHVWGQVLSHEHFLPGDIPATASGTAWALKIQNNTGVSPTFGFLFLAHVTIAKDPRWAGGWRIPATLLLEHSGFGAFVPK